MKHRPTGQYAGCVRVVLPDQKNPEAIFPLENAFPGHFDLINKSRTNFCEISRLAVPSQFRKRQGESKIPEGLIFTSSAHPHQREKRQIPVIALSLYWVSIGTGPLFDLKVLAIIEPRLARHFRRLGIITNRIGDLVEYHGKRGCVQIEAKKFNDNLKDDVRELFQFIDAERKRQLSSLQQLPADSSIDYDREVKIPLYAENKITEVWLIDVNQKYVEVYQKPYLNYYQIRQKLSEKDTLILTIEPDITIEVKQLF